MKYQLYKIAIMFFRGIHKQGEVNYDIEKILELAGKLKDAWEGEVLTESEKENCLMRIKSRGRSNKNVYKWYEQMQQDTFIREDSIALRGCIVLMREYLDKLESK